MRMYRKNKQRLFYALVDKTVPIYAKDSDGDIIYDEIDGEQVPRETGSYETLYKYPVEFYGNINSGNKGEAVAKAYGVSVGDFEAVLCAVKGELPIDEKTLIWYSKEPLMRSDGYVDTKTADYAVKRVPPCLKEIVYLLRRLDNA